VSAPGLLLPLLLGQATAEHVEQMSKVGEGRITGGWEYVWACYVIAWAGIALYAASLWARRRASAKRGIAA
jgi:hypothetical protein